MIFVLSCSLFAVLFLLHALYRHLSIPTRRFVSEQKADVRSRNSSLVAGLAVLAIAGFVLGLAAVLA